MMRILVVAVLIALISWGRTTAAAQHEMDVAESSSWSDRQALWHRAWAGAVPGLAADMAILKIFNIYARAQAMPTKERAPWWAALHYRLQLAQHMDPYFRDVYRLTEGLLAYEAQAMHAAVTLLSNSEPWLHSADPLLVASFIAHQELKDASLAIALAKRSAAQPDGSTLALDFATRLIHRQSGCHVALAFLESRLHTMPEPYQQGILRRIEQLREDKQCQQEIQASH